MGTKEDFVNAFHAAPSDADQEHFEQHQRNHAEDSHKSFFEGRKAKQTIRRQDVLEKMVRESLVDRVHDPSGPNVHKVTFSDFRNMLADFAAYEKEGRANDCPFQPFSRYANNLLMYADGRPRPTPLRPLLQNEVGMWGTKIVVLRDAGPDDLGEGKYHQVSEDISKKEE